MTLDSDLLISMYRSLAGTRIAEQAITDLARRGVLPGHHSGLGHESIGVGVGMAMQSGDCAQMSHRSGMMLAHARGGYSLREAILAKFGRAPSCFGQLSGRPRTLTVVGLVGTWVPMSVGVAMADQFRGAGTVTVTFFGDGAANEGAVHEAMNLAGARRLPIVFFIENNGFGVSLPVGEATATRSLASRSIGYGMPGQVVDGQDPVKIYTAAARALHRARDGLGPSVVELRLKRWEPHAEGLKDLRSAQELAAAREHDGVSRLRASVRRTRVLTEARLRAIEAQCRAEVDTAVADALQAGLNSHEPAPYDADEARRLAYAP
jgi:TPP-dependent pyruvate/acetoin dehydrogenase alpha subunit